MEKKKTNKKSLLLVLLALILTVGTIMGSIAWLTSTDSVTNSFTAGNITNPYKPNDPTIDPEDPSNSDGTDQLAGNLYEPHWDPAEEHKMLPGATFAKDPFVGIGPKSENSYVFAWANDATKVLEYTVNAYDGTNCGWKVVGGTVAADGKSALYVWCDASGDPLALVGKDNDSTWTTEPLFDTVTVDTDATTIEAGDMVVFCYIHQATSGDGVQDLYSEAETGALAEYNK
ncbi:MAG: hypothetical protein E7548_06840 [Ruminococcaceae bacterium]|nr:hypothetical protein [Oscillospiraceae bacterium]